MTVFISIIYISIILLGLLIMRYTNQTSKHKSIENEELHPIKYLNIDYENDVEAKLNDVVFDTDLSTIVCNLKDYKLIGTIQLDEHVTLYSYVIGEHILDISGCEIPKSATIEFEVTIGKNSTRKYSFGTKAIKNYYVMTYDNYQRIKIFFMQKYPELFQDEIKKLNYILKEKK